MTKKSEREAAVKKINDAADTALEELKESKRVAKQTIDDACEVAVKALETSSRIPDKRNIDGSYQWDRGDRYRRGSDDKIQRLEDKINGEKTQISTLEIGQARREEQIEGIRADIKSLHDELDTKKLEVEHLAGELAIDMKDLSNRLNIQHDLIIETRDASVEKIETAKDDIQKDKIRNQQYVIGIVVGLIVTFITTLVMVQFHV